MIRCTVPSASSRSERAAVLITSNFPPDERTETFRSESLTGELLNRLTHHVHILEMNGKSFLLSHSSVRKKRAQRCAELLPPSGTSARPAPSPRFRTPAPQAHSRPLSTPGLLPASGTVWLRRALCLLSAVDKRPCPETRGSTCNAHDTPHSRLSVARLPRASLTIVDWNRQSRRRRAVFRGI